MQEHNYDTDNAPMIEKFSSIELKFMIFVKNYRALQRENRELQIEQRKLSLSLEKLKNENKELKNQVNSSDDFQNSKKIAKIVSSKLKEANETAEWRGIIEELIEEIDRCTELLKAF